MISLTRLPIDIFDSPRQGTLKPRTKESILMPEIAQEKKRKLLLYLALVEKVNEVKKFNLLKEYSFTTGSKYDEFLVKIKRINQELKKLDESCKTQG
jgi:hypothetical protein